MIRVVHTADTHLGYRQYHKAEREDDFKQAFIDVIEYAIENDVNAVVHGGDLFHNSQPGTDPFMVAIEQLQRLKAAGIPFLSVVGNHDGQSSGPEWLDILQTMGLVTRLDNDPVDVGGVSFYGLDHKTRSERQSLSYNFTDSDYSNTVLVAHGLFDPLSVTADGHGWDLREVLSDSNIAFDAVLLGDDHTPNTKEVAGAVASYPGSTDRTASDQEATRGFNDITIGDDEVDVTHEKLDTRPFHRFTVELDDDDGLAKVKRAIDARDVSNACIFITVVGEGDSFTVKAVEEHALDNGAFLCRVRDTREFDNTEQEAEVNFADPDAALTDALDDMPLSDAALEITDIVRDDSTIPDSRLKSHSQDRLSETVEDNPDAFNRPVNNSPDDSAGNTLTEDQSQSNSESEDEDEGSDSSSSWGEHWEEHAESFG